MKQWPGYICVVNRANQFAYLQTGRIENSVSELPGITLTSLFGWVGD